MWAKAKNAAPIKPARFERTLLFDPVIVLRLLSVPWARPAINRVR